MLQYLAPLPPRFASNINACRCIYFATCLYIQMITAPTSSFAYTNIVFSLLQ